MKTKLPRYRLHDEDNACKPGHLLCDKPYCRDADVATLEAENERLREQVRLLLPYCNHHSGCWVFESVTDPFTQKCSYPYTKCSCGLIAILHPKEQEETDCETFKLESKRDT